MRGHLALTWSCFTLFIVPYRTKQTRNLLRVKQQFYHWAVARHTEQIPNWIWQANGSIRVNSLGESACSARTTLTATLTPAAIVTVPLFNCTIIQSCCAAPKLWCFSSWTIIIIFVYLQSLCHYCRSVSAKQTPVLRTYHLKTIFLWLAEEVGIFLTLVTWLFIEGKINRRLHDLWYLVKQLNFMDWFGHRFMHKIQSWRQRMLKLPFNSPQVIGTCCKHIESVW